MLLWLLAVLGGVQDRFINPADVCDVAVCRTQTIPKFLLCQRHIYRVADTLNVKVDRQIRELFSVDFICPSNQFQYRNQAAVTVYSPFVCTAKTRPRRVQAGR